MQSLTPKKVEANLICMAALMDKKWEYVINLCAHDYPLKTNFEIVRQLKAEWEIRQKSDSILKFTLKSTIVDVYNYHPARPISHSDERLLTGITA